MVAKNGEGICMSSCLVKLNPKRTCRYVFVARLWNGRLRKYDYDVKVLLDDNKGRVMALQEMGEIA